MLHQNDTHFLTTYLTLEEEDASSVISDNKHISQLCLAFTHFKMLIHQLTFQLLPVQTLELSPVLLPIEMSAISTDSISQDISTTIISHSHANWHLYCFNFSFLHFDFDFFQSFLPDWNPQRFHRFHFNWRFIYFHLLHIKCQLTFLNLKFGSFDFILCFHRFLSSQIKLTPQLFPAKRQLRLMLTVQL